MTPDEQTPFATGESAREERVEFSDDTRPVLIVDELAEYQAVEPLFAGMLEEQERLLQDACARVVSRLRERYAERYRNDAPEEDVTVFAELAGEVFIPHETLIGKLVESVERKKRIPDEEHTAILNAVTEFLERF